MGYDYKSICKNVLKKIYVCFAVAFVVALASLIFLPKNKVAGVYTAQVFIDQDFPEKHPEAGVAYLDSVESKTKVLMNNSIIVLQSKNYLFSVCKACDIKVKLNKINSMIKIIKESDNILSIEVSFDDLEISEKVCKKITETMAVQLNSVIRKNIDETTGNFKEGTPNSDKIIAYTLNEYSSTEEPQDVKVKTVLIYGSLAFILSACVLFLIEMIKNKAESVDYLRKCFDIAVDSVDSFDDGVIKMLAESKNDQKVVSFFANRIDNESIAKLNTKNHNIFKIVISDTKFNIDDENTKCFLTEDILLKSDELTTLIDKERGHFEKIVLILDDCFRNKALEAVLDSSEKSVLLVKKGDDTVKDIKTLITRINDKNYLITNICLYSKEN